MTVTTDQLLLLDPPESEHQAADDEVRLITFNAQHSSPERARRQAEWLASQDVADLLVVTEVGAGPGGQALVTALAQRGYRSVIAIPAPEDGSDYRTVLASRSADLETVDSGISVMSHRAPAARVRIGNRTVGLLGLYVPSRGPKERKNVAKRAFQEAVAEALPRFVKGFPGPVVVSGDLNVVEPGHVPHHSVFGKWEYDFYRAFLDAGLVDAYRHLHPDAVEHSWFGRSGNGYRFDHTFVTAGHAGGVQVCRYLHEPREQRLTDHAAMLLRLGLAAGPSTSPPGRRTPVASIDVYATPG